MDYKIVDGYTDPPGMTEQFYTEELMRLPRIFSVIFQTGTAPMLANFRR